MNEPTESCEESELNPMLSCGDKVTYFILYSKCHLRDIFFLEFYFTYLF